jgi:hypothetical protein
MGSLFGKPRSGDDREDERDGTIGQMARSLVQDAPPDMASELLDFFILQNKEELVSTRLPWFMPEWLGGLGLPNISNVYGNSDKDRRQATVILMQWNKRKPEAMGRADDKWKTRRITSKLLPPTTLTTNKEHPHAKQLIEYQNNLTVDLLFNSDFALKDLFEDDAGQDLGNRGAINRNAKLWEITKDRSLFLRVDPMPDKLIYDNPRYEGLAIVDTRTKPVSTTALNIYYDSTQSTRRTAPTRKNRFGVGRGWGPFTKSQQRQHTLLQQQQPKFSSPPPTTKALLDAERVLKQEVDYLD